MQGAKACTHPPSAALPLHENVLTLSSAFTLPLCLLGTWSISTLHRALLSTPLTSTFPLYPSPGREHAPLPTCAEIRLNSLADRDDLWQFHVGRGGQYRVSGMYNHPS